MGKDNWGWIELKPKEDWGWLQLKYQAHLEIAKIGISAMLAMLAIGIASSWYANQDPAPVWALPIMIVSFLSALVIGILSFVHFWIYREDLNTYAEKMYKPTTQHKTITYKTHNHEKMINKKLYNDLQNEFSRIFFEGLGIAAITLVLLNRWTSGSSAKLSSSNSLLVLFAGLACLFFAALLKIDIEQQPEWDKIQKRHKLLLTIVILALLILVWLVMGWQYTFWA